MLAQERPFQLKQLSRLSGTSIITVPVKAIAELHACKACVLHAHYTKRPCNVYKASTHLARKYPKMCATALVQLHAVDVLLRVNLLAVI